LDKVIYNDGFNFNADDLQFTEDSRISSIKCLAKSLVKFPGVATGLEITQPVAGSSQLLISLGNAINIEGELITILADQSYTVTAVDVGKYLCLSYIENDTSFEAHPITGVAAATRKLSSFALITKATAGSLDIILCQITGLIAGNVEWDLITRSRLGLTLADYQITNLFVAINAAIEERKIAFNDLTGHRHTGQGGTGTRIGYEHLKNLPFIPNPETSNRDLHASGIVSSNPEILKPTGSSAYNAVYFTPTLNNDDCAYIGGKKYVGLISGGLPLADLPGVYYNFSPTDSVGLYVVFADGLANGLIKAEVILSSADVQDYYDNKDYMPLCTVNLTSIGVVAPDTVVDYRPFGTIGLKDIWDLYNLQDKVTTIETILGVSGENVLMKSAYSYFDSIWIPDTTSAKKMSLSSIDVKSFALLIFSGQSASHSPHRLYLTFKRSGISIFSKNQEWLTETPLVPFIYLDTPSPGTYDYSLWTAWTGSSAYMYNCSLSILYL